MIIRYEYSDDIKNHRFGKIAALVRKGDISSLNQSELDLLADFLDGNLKIGRRGAPRKDEYGEAEHLWDECGFIMQYGMTRSEFSTFWEENVTHENYKNLLKSCKKIRITKAIKILADKMCMGEDNVKRLVYLGKNIEESA